jgi:hypothetical protein
MMTAMKSLEEYESHAPFQTTDKVKDATRAMMNIVEAVSEKGKMTDNQYLEMMNHLLTIHKSEDTPMIGVRFPRWTRVEHPRSEYVRITADAEAARERAHLANHNLATARAHLTALRIERDSTNDYENIIRDALSYSDNIL